jgi:hypothetical protein
MKVLIEFDPAQDRHAAVSEVVDAVFNFGLAVSITGTPMFNADEVHGSAMAQAAAGMTPAPLASAAVAQPALTANVAPVTTPNVSASSAPTLNVSAGGVNLDKAGIPWDARIHSSGVDETGQPKKSATGFWVKRRGVSEQEVTQVTSELLNLMAGSAGQVAAALPAGGVLGNPVHTPHQVAVPVAGSDDEYEIQQPRVEYEPTYTARNSEQFQHTPAPVAVAAPAVLAPMLAAPVKPTDFVGLMNYVSANLNTAANPAGKLYQADIGRIAQHFGLMDANGNPAIGLAQHRPELIGVLYDSFVNQIQAV